MSDHRRPRLGPSVASGAESYSSCPGA